jgi:CDP-4-dehydro-6-deoxyglucose reductase
LRRLSPQCVNAGVTAKHLIIVPIITLSGGRQFLAQDGETVLDAALRNGVTLEHSCRAGRCGSCKSRVCGDSKVSRGAELGLSADERAAGWILSCVSSATTDLALDVQDLGDAKLEPARTLPCRIQELEFLAANVMKVTLRLPPNSRLRYLPGQYIDVIGHGGLRRSYSIANAITPLQQIELHVRKVDGGEMSRYWFDQAKVDDLLRLNGPLGTFFLRNAADLNLLLLGTGTGIAPIKAMLEGLAGAQASGLPRSVTVFWGGRTAPDLYWDPATLAIHHRFVPVLSRADAGWTGARGHVQQAVLATIPDLGNAAVYACGSHAMIQGARTELVAAGLPKNRFHSDAFVSSSAA